MIKASARPTLPTSLPKFLLSLIEQCWDERWQGGQLSHQSTINYVTLKVFSWHVIL
jgi:hypothetical protein